MYTAFSSSNISLYEDISVVKDRLRFPSVIHKLVLVLVLTVSFSLIDIIHNFTDIWRFSAIFSRSSRMNENQSSSNHSHFHIETPFNLWNITKDQDFLTWMQLFHSIHTFCIVAVQTLVTRCVFCSGVYVVECWNRVEELKKILKISSSTRQHFHNVPSKIKAPACRYTGAGATVDLWRQADKNFCLGGHFTDRNTDQLLHRVPLNWEEKYLEADKHIHFSKLLNNKHFWPQTHKNFPKCSQDSGSFDQITMWVIVDTVAERSMIMWGEPQLKSSPLTARHQDQPGYRHHGNRDQLGQHRETDLSMSQCNTHSDIQSIFTNIIFNYYLFIHSGQKLNIWMFPIIDTLTVLILFTLTFCLWSFFRRDFR